MNKITIVLVMYNQKIAELPVYDVLKQLEGQEYFCLLLYDNSLVEQENPFTAENIHYIHDKTNPGLAKAYNYAWKMAKENHSDALLLLDDDTQVGANYLKELLKLDLPENIGAVVPQIFDGDKQVSPVYADSYINRYSQYPSSGLENRRVMAINSATLIPVKVLNKIKGFNEAFPLDFLDHWFFWRIHQENYKVLILEDTLQHQLSVLDYENVSTQRYQNILAAEHLYYAKYDKDFASTHKKQLIKRVFKQFLTVKNRKIWHITLREIFKKMEN